ncbi:MAG: ATP-grasp fold amidoligase family protein, partial [Aeromicrobium sp.]
MTIHLTQAFRQRARKFVGRVRSRARELPHVAWRDNKIAELTESRARAAKELTKARTALVDAPSFDGYIHAQRRIHSHMRDGNDADRASSLSRKLKAYSFAQSHGLAIPKLYGMWNQPEHIDWDELPDEVVIKSLTGSSGRGVFPLRRVDGKWTMVTVEGSIAPEEIVERISERRAEHRIGGPFFAEQLLHGRGQDTLPVDAKILSFYGEVGHVLLRTVPMHTDQQSIAFRIIRPDGSDPGDILRGHPYDPDIPIPENLDSLMDTAKMLSANIPAAYMRVDLYDIDSTVVFGEFTPRPGGSQ